MKERQTTGFAPSRTATSHRTATGRLLLITLLLLAFAGGARADEVEIGSSDNTSTSYRLPINPYYNYSLTQQIFTTDEIGMAGTINSISFYYTYTESLTMEGIKMYMKNVNKEQFVSDTDIVQVSDGDLVWEGTLEATGAGWVTIDLDTPFAYDVTSNLLVCLYDPTNGHLDSSFKFRTTTTTEYLAIAYYGDTYKPYVNDVSTYNGNKSRFQYRSNIKLDITSGSGLFARGPLRLRVPKSLPAVLPSPGRILERVATPSSTRKPPIASGPWCLTLPIPLTHWTTSCLPPPTTPV